MTTIGSALVISIILLPAEIAFIGHKMKLPRFIAAEKKLACDAQNSSAPNTPNTASFGELGCAVAR